MKHTFLSAKLHRVNVTQVELDYEGSCAVDSNFLEASGMHEYQKVGIYNVTNVALRANTPLHCYITTSLQS